MDIEDYHRVLHEYKLHCHLKHDNICKAVELISEELDDKAYIIMEYCEGKTLRHMIKSNRIYSEEDLRPMVNQILSGVEYMHKIGVCHRDLKPSNIIVDKDN
mmetsp:Transcript_26573/g.23552  ORF Transcript_26573/g.23552 Transcript_26573/m.23552 type:complete len:102 (-) Transcript_26573:777-1082(-)